MSLQLKQEMGSFQASILEAFNKFSDQQRSLQEQINEPGASATVSKKYSHSVDQLDPDPLPGTSPVSDPNPRPSDLRDTGLADFARLSLPPHLQKRGQVSDPPSRGVSDPESDHSYHKRGAKPPQNKDKRKHKYTKYISSL